MFTVRWLMLGLAMFVGMGFAHARPEQNAFLNKPVHDKDALIKQMRSDPKVLARFQKHYKMDKEQLTNYFSSLRLISIKTPKHYLTFNIDDKMVIRRKKTYYPIGTLVFVDRNGVPVLKRSCGNPMSYGPQGLQRVAFEGKRRQTILPEAPIDAAEFGFAPEPILAVALPEETLVEEVAPTPTPTPTPAPGAATPAPAAAGAPILPIAVFTPWPWLVGGGIVGGIIDGFNNGGGGGEEPVPEPATILAISAGAAVMMRRRRS